jgi:hypothetical protein
VVRDAALLSFLALVLAALPRKTVLRNNNRKAAVAIKPPALVGTVWSCHQWDPEVLQVSALTLIPITRIRTMKTSPTEDLTEANDFLDSPCPQVVLLLRSTTVLWWVALPPLPMKQLARITTSRARRTSRSRHPRQTGAHKIRINLGKIKLGNGLGCSCPVEYLRARAAAGLLGVR